MQSQGKFSGNPPKLYKYYFPFQTRKAKKHLLISFAGAKRAEPESTLLAIRAEVRKIVASVIDNSYPLAGHSGASLRVTLPISIFISVPKCFLEIRHGNVWKRDINGL
ncbi:hypothetical protein NPIL_578301 [Nephila pilipes]|uniref:Uncharacterized protein n=1 Tax=Nephila pilipes TaxID=299642 RepID=A0A8X6P7Z5_NEPPI|nr:hypothetical protein NPIL_578301 [Nephila pilipes]